MTALVVIVVLVIGAFIVWITTWRPRITIGQPTPEEARVKVDAAEEKARRETEEKVEEVRDEPLDKSMRRAGDLIRRGLHGK